MIGRIIKGFINSENLYLEDIMELIRKNQPEETLFSKLKLRMYYLRRNLNIFVVSIFLKKRRYNKESIQDTKCRKSRYTLVIRQDYLSEFIYQNEREYDYQDIRI